LRGWHPGEYIINVHMFNKKSPDLTNITVQMIKINPYRILFEEKVVMLKRGEEITIRRITLNKLGSIIDTNKDPISIINDPTEFTDSRVEPQSAPPPAGAP